MRAPVFCAVLLAFLAGNSVARDPAPFTARAGLELAWDAARSWSSDAQLIYLENDEDVAANGMAVRWSYLFYSPSRGKARGYSVRDSKILEAADLGFDFEAPPLPNAWIDSEAALTAAEKKVGLKYREDHSGRLSTMLLIRGAFDDKKPDTSTWTLVYTSDANPSLFVVVDAADGRVVKTWKG